MGFESLNMVSVHGTLKLVNRNWKFGRHAFVLLFKDEARVISTEFLFTNFKFQAVNGYKIFSFNSINHTLWI
jgi:hypothetical protein